MIRHSNSFLISIFVHIILFMAFFVTYKAVVNKEEVKEEKKVLSVALCNFIEKKPQVIQKAVPKQKEIKPQKIAKKKKPEVLKTVKKEIPVQTPLKKELVVEEEPKELVELPKEEPQEEIQAQEEVVTQTAVDVVEEVESEADKQVRMQKEYINKNINKIRELIVNNLYYPRRARKQGIVGEVVVKFHLSKDASVHAISIISSEHEILSRAAVKTIENLSTKFPNPESELILNVPIVYKLKN